MASALYNEAKAAMLTGALNLTQGTNTINAVLVDTGTYTFSAAHDNYTTHISGHIVGSPVAIANKTTTDGVFNGDDVTFTSVSGNTIEAIVIYDATNDILIAYIDSFSQTTPNGNNIDVVWDTNIFSL